MITLTAEQAQQIEEALESVHGLSGINMSNPLATIRAARAQDQAETPFQLGQRLAREGQGISAIVYEIERDSDFDECLRGMRSVWNGDNFVVKRKQAEQEPVAWRFELKAGEYAFCSQKHADANRFMLTPENHAIPLYAAPVRTKDLTDDDIADVFRAIHMKESWSLVFARAVIAADREKNK